MMQAVEYLFCVAGAIMAAVGVHSLVTILTTAIAGKAEYEIEERENL